MYMPIKTIGPKVESQPLNDNFSDLQNQVDTHQADDVRHVTQLDKDAWNTAEANAKKYADDTKLDLNKTTKQSLKGDILLNLKQVLAATIPVLSYGANSFSGNQDDVLAYADKAYTVINTGDVATNLDRAFTPGHGYASWTNLVSTVIEITLSETHYWRGIGVVFTYGKRCDNIKVETYRTNLAAWKTDFDGPTDGDYNFIDVINSNVTKIKITLSGSSNTGDVNLERVFGYTPHKVGNTYLQKGGGDIYGDVHKKSGTTRPPLWYGGTDGGSGAVEYGSNANGHYVRYPNGVQECWMYEFALPSRAAGIYLDTIIFPAAFIAYPSVQATAMETMGQAVVYTYDHKSVDLAYDRFKVRWEHKYGSSISVRISHIARGRWK
jgi:hypothetical protein